MERKREKERKSAREKATVRRRGAAASECYGESDKERGKERFKIQLEAQEGTIETDDETRRGEMTREKERDGGKERASAWGKPG